MVEQAWEEHSAARASSQPRSLPPFALPVIQRALSPDLPTDHTEEAEPNSITSKKPFNHRLHG